MKLYFFIFGLLITYSLFAQDNSFDKEKIIKKLKKEVKGIKYLETVPGAPIHNSPQSPDYADNLFKFYIRRTIKENEIEIDIVRMNILVLIYNYDLNTHKLNCIVDLR